MRWLIVCLGLIATGALAGERSGTVQSTRLYTPPDPSAAGGIQAVLAMPRGALVGVYAMPTHDFKQVYRGNITDEGRGFRFTGLPVGKYDLLLQYADGFDEGFTLSRVDDQLTARDRESIAAAIRRAVAFFDTKAIHRVAGVPGPDGEARCVLQELRTRKILAQSAEELTGYQIRSFKLAVLREVGAVGWQLVETRELVRTEVAPGDPRGILEHRYCPALGGIRVTDAVKDLGTLRLESTSRGDAKIEH